MQIQISCLLKKPTDLDLDFLQRRSISGFNRTKVKIFRQSDMQCNMSCFFSNFSENVKLGILCESPMIYMKFQTLFSEKNTKDKQIK